MRSYSRNRVFARLLITVSLVVLTSLPALAAPPYTVTITIDAGSCTQSPSTPFAMNEGDTVNWTSGPHGPEIQVKFPDSRDSNWPNSPFLLNDGTWKRTFDGTPSTETSPQAQLTDQERTASPVTFNYLSVTIGGVACNNVTSLVGIQVSRHP